MAKIFVKIEHAQKVAAIEKNMFFSDSIKTTLAILIKIAVRMHFKVF